jgi:predicted nucleotidyltransferase
MQTVVNDIDESIIKTLLYFDIFQYPLKASEIFLFIDTVVDKACLEGELCKLVACGAVFKHGDLYSMQPSPSAYSERRLKGNREAERYLSVAHRQAMLISKFPFVRAVLVSGSLSKGYMDEKSDIDFFIVTKANRLWIARTLLVIYKRLFLFNSHQYFCVNYFVDTAHLPIEEKNIYTATELVTLIPLYGCECCEQLKKANEWVHQFFPNYQFPTYNGVPDGRGGWFKNVLETCIDFLGGERFDKFLMTMTGNRWRRLYGKLYNAGDFKLAFKTERHASKNHPKFFQKKVVDMYQRKVRQHFSQLQVS